MHGSSSSSSPACSSTSTSYNSTASCHQLANPSPPAQPLIKISCRCCVACWKYAEKRPSGCCCSLLPFCPLLLLPPPRAPCCSLASMYAANRPSPLPPLLWPFPAPLVVLVGLVAPPSRAVM